MVSNKDIGRKLYDALVPPVIDNAADPSDIYKPYSPRQYIMSCLS